MARKIRFAVYPSALVFSEPKSDSKKVNQLLWGDWIQVLEENGDWARVNVRGDKDGWMKTSDFQTNKLVEIYFVDIGQGDGCLVLFPVATPDGEEPKDRAMLIDAGKRDNMLRFINWKFHTKNELNPSFPFKDVVISHSDDDHYGGFQAIFENQRFSFENVYHNGLIERAGGENLGGHQRIGNVTYQTDVISTPEELAKIINNPDLVGDKKYPKLLKTAAERGAKIRMLCDEDKFLPGFEADKEIKIRVLAPVVEKNGDGKRLLRRLKSDDGKTKNGHSVVLRLEYGDVKILLGGDLNVPAENYLLKHYTQINPQNASVENTEKIVEKAQQIFGADVAKACHHGSGDFSTTFLRAVNAAATVISSGDDEPHAHPRPNTLGALGKYGRGEFPLIFSTEMARSAKEKIKRPSEVHREIDFLITEIGALGTRTDAEAQKLKERLEKRKKELFLTLGRTIEIFGMINVRTDGKKILIAQKLEQPKTGQVWDIHCLEPKKQPDGSSVLTYKDDAEKHD